MLKPRKNAKRLGYIFDIGLLSFNDGTYPVYKFIPNIIYN